MSTSAGSAPGSGASSFAGGSGSGPGEGPGEAPGRFVRTSRERSRERERRRRDRDRDLRGGTLRLRPTAQDEALMAANAREAELLYELQALRARLASIEGSEAALVRARLMLGESRVTP